MVLVLIARYVLVHAFTLEKMQMTGDFVKSWMQLEHLLHLLKAMNDLQLDC